MSRGRHARDEQRRAAARLARLAAAARDTWVIIRLSWLVLTILIVRRALPRAADAGLAQAKLAFGSDADGPGGPLEHLPSCDGTCGGAVAHAAHLDDGWCPCCYCAQFAVTPAPASGPVQAPRPVDPPREMARGDEVRAGATPRTPGAVADGTGTSAGVPPAPVTAAAEAVPPSAGAAAPLPLPALPQGSPGQGQHPQRQAWVIFPDDRAAVTRAGRVTIEGLHARHRAPATEPIRVNAIRPYYERHQEWRDMPARWTA